MKIINIILIALISLLSIAAGLAKIMQVPQEMEFLTLFEFTPSIILMFGVVQVLGGVLIAIPKLRLAGAILIIIVFLLSATLVFLTGNLSFGLISILPVAATGWIIYQNLNSAQNNEALETKA